MKILKQGKLPEDTEYTTNCYNCKTKFSFLQKEAKWNHSCGYEESSFLLINCPFCSKIVNYNPNPSYYGRD